MNEETVAYLDPLLPIELKLFDPLPPLLAWAAEAVAAKCRTCGKRRWAVPGPPMQKQKPRSYNEVSFPPSLSTATGIPQLNILDRAREDEGLILDLTSPLPLQESLSTKCRFPTMVIWAQEEQSKEVEISPPPPRAEVLKQKTESRSRISCTPFE